MSIRESQDEIWRERLWHRLRMIQALENHAGGRHWDLASPGSELAADDAKTSPFQTSHIVGHCLSFGLDCLRTTRMILVNPAVEAGIRLPLAGHFPAIRSGMEAGAQAIWMLSSNHAQERVERTLRARWEDVIQDDQMVLALTAADTADDKSEIARKNKMRREHSRNVRAKKKRLREAATRAGVSEGTMLLGLPGYGPMLIEAATSTGMESNHQYGMWRLVSGLTHPSASRSIAMSVVEDKLPGHGDVMMAELTASTSLTNSALDAALLLHWRALDLAALRGDKPELKFTPSSDLIPPGHEVP